MSDLERHQRALQRAQAAGDAEAAAIIQQRIAAAQQPTRGAAATPAPAAPQQAFQRAGEGSVGHRLLGGGALASGIGDSAIRSYLGVKQFFGGLSDDEKGVLAQMDQEQARDPDKLTRIGGNVVGTVAQMANPLTLAGSRAAAASRAGQAFLGSKAAQVLAANPALAAGFSGGVQGLLLNPGEGEGYLDQMGGKLKEAAKSAIVGGVLNKAVRALAAPATGMFKATPEAEQLFAQGVNPTLQQGAAGPVGKFVGGLTSGAFDVKSRQRDEIGNALLSRISQGQQSLPGGTGREFLESAQNAIDNDYNALWAGKKVDLSKGAVAKIMEEVSRVPKSGRGAMEANEAARLMVNRLGPAEISNQRFNYSTFAKEIRNKITRDAYETSGDVRDRMLAGREVLDNLVTRKNLSGAETAQLDDINIRNFDLKRLEEAVRGVAQGEEGLSVRRLAEAYGRKAKEAASMGNTTADTLVNPAARIIGNTPNQDMSRTAWQAAKKMGVPALGATLAGGPGLGTAVAALPIGISLLGQTAPGAKALLGQYPTQKAMAEALRKIQPALYGTIGAADFNMEDPYAP